MRFAFVRNLQECEEGLGVEGNVVSDLAECLENLLPVQVREELPECAHQVVDTPLNLILLVDHILLEQGAVSLLVRFKCVLGNLRSTVIIASVVDTKVEERLSHGLLIDIFKVLEYL